METIDERISKKIDRRKLLKGLGIGGAIGTSFILGNKLRVAEATTTQYPISFGSYASSSAYTIFQDTTKTYAKNGRTGAIDFSALTSEDFTANIMQPIINALSTTEGGTSTYARGGIVTMYAGSYHSTTPWILPTDVSHAFQMVLQGSGKSDTIIYIEPSVTVASAILTGYSTWVSGEYSPKLTFRDLSMLISGTYTGTDGISGTKSIVDLTFYDVFLEDMQLSINATPSGSDEITMICVGAYAGPSEPVTWKHVEIDGMLGGSTYPFKCLLWEWYEGFTWFGGKVEMDGNIPNGYSSAFGTGIALYGNGPTVVEGVSNYGNANVNCYISLSGGDIVLNNLGYPAPGNVRCHIAGGYSPQVVVIINTQEASAVNHGMHLIPWVAGGMVSLKTIGFSFGKQATPFYVPNSGQATIGVCTDGTGVSAPVASKDYLCNTDLLVTSTGGTGVSISILDDFGNTITSGLATLTAFRFSQGMHINFGGFSVAPTVSAYQVGG